MKDLIKRLEKIKSNGHEAHEYIVDLIHYEETGNKKMIDETIEKIRCWFMETEFNPYIT